MNDTSFVSRKQSTCLRAWAGFVISIETCAGPLLRVTGTLSQANDQPQYMLILLWGSTMSAVPNSCARISFGAILIDTPGALVIPYCVILTTKFSLLPAKSA